MKKYKVKMWWYSEVEVEAKNRSEAEDIGVFNENSEPHLDSVEVEIIK